MCTEIRLSREAPKSPIGVTLAAAPARLTMIFRRCPMPISAAGRLCLDPAVLDQIAHSLLERVLRIIALEPCEGG